MRIAIACSGLGHVARGMEAWAAGMAELLAARGLDLTLYKGGGSAELPYEVVIPCWQRGSRIARSIHRLARGRVIWRWGFGSTYAIEQTTFSRGLLRHLKRTQPDILHLRDPGVASAMQRAARAGELKARVLLGHSTNETLDYLSRFDHVTQLAPYYLEESQQAGVAKPLWTVLPNFVDASLYSPGRSPGWRAELNLPDEALVVLSVANLDRRVKRIDYLIDEFATLRAARPELPAYLVVAGGWVPESDALIAEGEAKLGERVRFLVRVSRERMPDLYRAADLFCLCSLKEMMPNAGLEACASGLPCLVHHHPVIAWTIGPGGLALDLTQPGLLAEHLAELLSDEAERRRLGAAARDYCLANFDREAVVEQYLAYYERVLTEM